MLNILKKISVILLGIVAASAVACNENEEPKDGPITVNPESLEFVAAGETKSVTVTGKNWDVTKDAEWISVTKADDKITVVVGVNEAEEEREGVITVKNNEETKTVSVTQAAAEPVDTSLEVDPDELLFDVAGGTETVTVTSVLEWDATTENDWIEIVKGDGSFTVTVQANTSLDALEGAITVSNGENEKTVTVEQVERPLDPALTVDPETLSFDAATGTKSVSVTSEMQWSVTKNEGWITVEKLDGIFNVTVTANTSLDVRTGSVTVSNGENQKSVAIQQAGRDLDPTITVDPGTLTFAWNGGNTSSAVPVTVTSEMEWTLTKDDWIYIHAQTATGFSVYVPRYTSSEPRSGVITISNGVTQKTITVNQEGRPDQNIYVNPESLSFGGEGGSQTVSVTSIPVWSSTTYDSWITVEKLDDGTLKVTAAANDTAESRTGSVQVSNTATYVKYISVSQEGRAPSADITVNPETLSFVWNGGNTSSAVPVTVTSEMEWTLTKDDWIYIHAQTATGFSVYVPRYTSPQPRSGVITISNGVNQKTITVEQEGRPDQNIYVNPESLSFVAAGGDQTVSVTSIPVWSSTTYDSWITVEKLDGGNLKVTAAANDTAESRTGTVQVSNTATYVKYISVSQDAGEGI